MENQKTFDLIDQYLSGELVGEALAAFEKELQSNPALSKRVALIREMSPVLADEKALYLRKQLKGFGDEYFIQSKKKEARIIPIYKRSWAVAAAMLALVASVVLVWQINSNSALSGDQLYAQNFELYNIPTESRGQNSESDFAKAAQLYDKKAYQKSAEIFDTLLKKDPSDMLTAFCLAQSYLNQNPPKTASAKTLLQNIIQDGNSVYVSKSKWYLALIYVKEGAVQNAFNLLREVADEGGSQGKKATDLIRDLE